MTVSSRRVQRSGGRKAELESKRGRKTTAMSYVILFVQVHFNVQVRTALRAHTMNPACFFRGQEPENHDVTSEHSSQPVLFQPANVFYLQLYSTFFFTFKKKEIERHKIARGHVLLRRHTSRKMRFDFERLDRREIGFCGALKEMDTSSTLVGT